MRFGRTKAGTCYDKAFPTATIEIPTIGAHEDEPETGESQEKLDPKTKNMIKHMEHAMKSMQRSKPKLVRQHNCTTLRPLEI